MIGYILLLLLQKSARLIKQLGKYIFQSFERNGLYFETGPMQRRYNLKRLELDTILTKVKVNRTKTLQLEI